MAIDINLISDNDLKNTQSDRVRKLTAISFSILFFTAFFSFLIFILNLRFSANTIRQNQQELSNALSIYDDKATKILILNNRATDINSLLKTRKDFSLVLAKIVDEKPSNVEIENFRIERNNVDMTVTSPSLLSLNEFLNNLLITESDSVKFSNILLKSLNISEGGFVLVINMQTI